CSRRANALARPSKHLTPPARRRPDPPVPPASTHARRCVSANPGPLVSPVLFLRIPLAQRPCRVIPQSSPGIAFPNYADISGASPLNHPTDPPHPIPLVPPRPNPSCHALCAGANPLHRRNSTAPPHRGPVQGAHRLRLDCWSFPGPAAL